MGDLQVGEPFKDKWYVKETATGNPWLLQIIPVVVIDESGNRAVAVNATEESDGWYYLNFTPDAAGTWATEATLAGATFVNNNIHYFKVGGGEVTDIKADTAAIKAKTDLIGASVALEAGGNLATVVADTPYLADAALPAAPTAGSIGSRFTGLVVLETTIAALGSTVTTCRLSTGSDNNNAYKGMLVVLDDDAGDFEYVSRTITGYTGATKEVTFTPQITEASHVGGKVWIVASDTAANANTDLLLLDHGVPGQNSGNNAVMRDVIGNKTDTTAGTSIVSLIKIADTVVDNIHDTDLPDVHTDLGTAIAAIGTVDGFHDVPAQNSADNSQVRDVVGNKTDTTAGNSVVSLVKIVDALHDVPAQNSADNNQARDVLGNKTDTTAGNSVIAILKQILEDTGTTLDDLVDDLETRLSAARAGYLDKLANRLQTVTFFSPCQAEVVADTSHTDASMPTVTIPNITGTIMHVYAGFKFRMIENTNAAANKLSGAQEIQINKAGGAWTDAINLVDDQFGLAASTREGGDCIIGYTDLVGTIDVFNTTAQFQWDEPLTDQNAIHFNDVQTFVIIQYY